MPSYNDGWFSTAELDRILRDVRKLMTFCLFLFADVSLLFLMLVITVHVLFFVASGNVHRKLRRYKL